MKKYLLFLFSTLLISFASPAQESLIKKGDYHYKLMAYTKAIPYYAKAAKKDSTNYLAVSRLADCYRLTNNKYMAEKWYGHTVSLPPATALDKYHYAQSLLKTGKNAEARKYMEDFVLANQSDGRGQAFMRAIENYESFFADSSNYQVNRLDINTTFADFGAAVFNDGIVFASSREETNMIKRTHSWTGQPFLQLYYSRGTDTKFRSPEPFEKNIQNKFNDGPICFSKKGDEVFVTRNNIEDGKVLKSADRVVKLKIYRSKNTGDKWSDLEPFVYNSNEYNTAHPALSPDARRLYFVSDMPGGKGGQDIWMCERSSVSEAWSSPVNLGDSVNSRGNEMFPYVLDDGTLYFSSDGHPGIGGLDIFYTREIAGRFVPPVNVGYPLNSNDDDFSMSFDLKNKVGYLSSNRLNKGFDDDIYSFKKKSVRIRGIVVNKENGQPIANAKVELREGSSTIPFVTSASGKFDFTADFDKEYVVYGTATDMGDSSVSVSTPFSSPSDPFVRIELGKPYKYALSIEVIDGDTKEHLTGALIMDELSNVEMGNTDMNGYYRQALIPQKDEQIRVSMPGYRPKIIKLAGQGSTAPKDAHYLVELRKASGVAPFENWVKIIYFDLDKYDVRNDASTTLDEVVKFMKEHPEVKISLASHTDSRATAEYNQRLSQNRSKQAREYLISKGVNSKQIGKITNSGESILVNDCSDDHPCTEEMHQLNRRTEITVIELMN